MSIWTELDGVMMTDHSTTNAMFIRRSVLIKMKTFVVMLFVSRYSNMTFCPYIYVRSIALPVHSSHCDQYNIVYMVARISRPRYLAVAIVAQRAP